MDTAWKGLLDRARVSGNSLTRIDSELLADLLTQCTQVYKNAVRFLIRDEMITAVVSGDETDYKVLPMQVLQSSDFMRILVDVYWINISILQLLRKQLNYNLSTGINKFLKTLSKSKKVIDIFTLTCYSMCQ